MKITLNTVSTHNISPDNRNALMTDLNSPGYVDETRFPRNRDPQSSNARVPSQSAGSAWLDPSSSQHAYASSGYNVAPISNNPGYDPLRANLASSSHLHTSSFPSTSAVTGEHMMDFETYPSQHRGGAGYEHPGYYLPPDARPTRGHLGDASSMEYWSQTPRPTSSPSSMSFGSSDVSTPLDETPPAKRRRVSAPPSGKTRAPSNRPPRKATDVPQNRRFHNMVDNSQSTMLPSGSMFITFPVEKPGTEPMQVEPVRVESCPPAFEHGPTELPPRPYPRSDSESKETEDAPGTSKKNRRTLPSNVMDHLPTLEGRLCNIEMATQRYIDYRVRRAVEKSLLPEK
ncbi:hypothetical protein DENSPDRAFT_199744 [Dentipellis sp. KUC8613]|nr:hypothetical protein DENSPDRAFT_199744 [Dentipellis sp. KUC8613]